MILKKTQPHAMKSVLFRYFTITYKTAINMKPIKFKHQLLLLFGLSIMAWSCSSDDDSNNNQNTQAQIQASVTANTWIITRFVDSGNDETGHFSCYAFQFGANGTLTATSSNNTYTGTWSITDSNSNDDSQDDLDFNINFNLTNEFEDLNDDWDIISYSSNSIALIDVSGGNGGTDYLTFTVGAPNSNCSSETQTTIQDNVATGTWRITNFVDSGTDETTNFSGYNFTFNSSGVLNANNGTTEYNGTWSITDSNSNDDHLDDLDFNINFNLTNNFQDLNDDWDFVSQSATRIELIDVSGGGGGTDYLTFEKN